MFYRVAEVAERLDIIGQRGITKSSFSLDARNLWIREDRVIFGEKSREPEDFTNDLLRFVARKNRIRDDQRSCVDERVSRHTLLVLQLHD